MAINRTYPIGRLTVVLALLMTSGAATVHAQKVAYVATEAIVEKLPEAKAARSKLSELQLSWMRDIQRQEQEISKTRGDIETNRLLWSAQEKRDAESRLADLESRLAAFRSAKFGPNQEFERQQSEMMGPIIDRVSKAIEDEARSGKYDIVFDKSSRGLPILYANPAIDITWAVLKRLGVEPTEASGGPGGRVEPDSKREQDARRNRGPRDIQMPNPFGNDPIDPNKVLDPNKNGDGSGTGTGTGTDGSSGKSPE